LKAVSPLVVNLASLILRIHALAFAYLIKYASINILELINISEIESMQQLNKEGIAFLKYWSRSTTILTYHCGI